MLHHAWSALALASAVLIGCGPGKELPDEVPKSKGGEQGSTEPKEQIPKESDPAAKEIVERAIKAHTQNNRGLLETGKISKSTATGTIKLPVEGRFANPQTARQFLAVWPDRINVAYEHKTELNYTTRLVLRFPQLVWLGRDTKQEAIPNPELLKDIMLRDTLAQHWLPLMFPLTQPRAVVFAPRKGVGTPPMDSVRLFYPDRPLYNLSFDTATGLLARVDYMQYDQNQPILTEWMFADFKPSAGMMLPMKITSARTTERPKVRDDVEEWAVERWEFPEKIDDSAFDPPK